MTNFLKQICADKSHHVKVQKRTVPLASLETSCVHVSPPRGFIKHLEAKIRLGEYSLIAEIKKASPSKGIIRHEFSVGTIAKAYEAGGASCLSVLTDFPSFERSRIAGVKKVNEFRDGFLILISILRLLIVKK